MLNGFDAHKTTASATVITVMSGKGGVGKTNIATNLAIALAQSGKKTALLDMDLGLANAHVLLGLRPAATLSDVIAGKKEVEQIIVPGPAGVAFVPGGSADEQLANLPPAALQRLLNGLSSLSTSMDYLIIDTAAGLSSNTLRLAMAADAVVVVTTPEPTALLDAYAAFKSLRAGNKQNLFLLVNMARTVQEGNQAARRLNTVLRSFWQSSLDTAHCVPYDTAAGDAVRRRVPLLLHDPHTPAARSIRAFATTITSRQLTSHGLRQREPTLIERLLGSLKAQA